MLASESRRVEDNVIRQQKKKNKYLSGREKKKQVKEKRQEKHVKN